MKSLPSMLAAACLLAAGCTAPGSSTSEKGLDDVRVCGVGAYDKGDSACTRDQSRGALVSSHFYCSASLGGNHEGESFRGRFLFEGRPFPASQRPLPKNTGHVSINVFTGGTELPGGRWSCELRVGSERVQKAFSSGGPLGAIIDVSACPTSVTTRPASVCSPTWTQDAIPATDSITCSATFAGALGKVARVDLRFEGKPAGVHFERKLPLPVSAFSVKISSNRGNLSAGSYACVYSLDGKTVATKEFTIAK